jgi:hypothetical protein
LTLGAITNIPMARDRLCFPPDDGFHRNQRRNDQNPPREARTMRMLSIRTCLTPPTLGLLAFFCGAANADLVEPAVGTLKSVGSVDSLKGISISVQPLDFDEISEAMQAFIVKTLEARGYTVRPDGDRYTLSFTTELSAQTEDQAPNTDETATEIGAGDEDLDAAPRDQDDSVSVDPDVEVPLDSGGDNSQSSYSLSFILTSSSEVPVWQGSVTAQMQTQDSLSVAKAMVPPLVEHMGQAVSARPVTLK